MISLKEILSSNDFEKELPEKAKVLVRKVLFEETEPKPEKQISPESINDLKDAA